MEQVRLVSPVDFSMTSLPGRSEFRARLVRAGQIKRADGTAGHIVIPEIALATAVSSNLFDGLAVFTDHPGPFENAQVKHLVGVTYDSYFDSSCVMATIRFYDDEEQGANRSLAQTVAGVLRMIFDDVANDIPTPDVGISIVFWPDWDTGCEGPRILKGFKKIDSADIVFSPAADGRILEALSTYSTSLIDTAYNAVVKEVLMTEHNTSPSAAEELQAPAAETHESPLVEEINDWAAAAQAVAVPAILAGSGLPEASRMRLLRSEWRSPEELSQAVEAEQDYLAELTQDQVIQMPGSHPRGAGLVSMRTSLDRIGAAAEAFSIPKGSCSPM